MFPITYSLLSQQAIALHIQDNYEIGPIIDIGYFLRGMNDTYLAATNAKKYVFRVYRADRKNRSDIEFELELLQYLGGHGIGVSEPIRKKDGSFINEQVRAADFDDGFMDSKMQYFKSLEIGDRVGENR